MKNKNLALVCLALLAAMPSAFPESASDTTAQMGWLGGLSEKASPKETSQAWEVYFKQFYRPYLGFGVAYLNEGHFQGHLRDGVAVQYFTQTPRFFNQQVGVDFGVGPYFYSDTTYAASMPGVYQNQHGVAVDMSATATLYTLDPFLLNAGVARIQAFRGFNTNLLFLGMSWDLDKPFSRVPSFSAPDTDLNQAVSLSYGRTMVDGKPVAFSQAIAAQYHYSGLAPFDFSGGFLNEGKNHLTDRRGVDGMVWLKEDFYHRRMSVEAGAGPYLFKDTETRESGMATMLGLAANYQVTNHYFTRVEWDRIMTKQNRDSDVYTLGVGYRF